MTCLFIILIAHILGDFLFQPDFIARGRNSGEYSGHLRLIRIIIFNIAHCIIHGIVLALCACIFNVLCGQSLNISISAYIIILAVHFIIDILKPLLIDYLYKLKVYIDGLLSKLKLGSFNYTYNKGRVNFIVFILDQLIHIVFIFIICSTLFDFSIDKLYRFIIDIKIYPYAHDKILFVIFILLTATFEAAYFSKFLLDSIKTLSKSEDNFTEAKSGGFIIGILERIFIILGIVMGQPSVIAIVLTLKSVVRYKKFGEDTFAEYYIIGTFLSFVIAIASGLLISNII